MARHAAADVGRMKFMSAVPVAIDGIDCFVSRSGYTGEDGYEISAPGSRVVALAEALLAGPEVAPIGLGARDSLRLERSEEHTSELQSLMRLSYAVFCLKKKKKQNKH